MTNGFYSIDRDAPVSLVMNALQDALCMQGQRGRSDHSAELRQLSARRLRRAANSTVEAMRFTEANCDNLTIGASFNSHEQWCRAIKLAEDNIHDCLTRLDYAPRQR